MFKRAVACLLLLILPTLTFAQEMGTTWTKVRYNGGPLQTKVDPKNWDNKLTVTSDVIRFVAQDGAMIEIAPKDVTTITYGQEAHRHVAMMVSLGVLVTPLALFGLFHKQKLHFIGIEYEHEGKKGGLLIQGANDNYKAMLFQLKSVTGKEVQLDESEKLGAK